MAYLQKRQDGGIGKEKTRKMYRVRKIIPNEKSRENTSFSELCTKIAPIHCRNTSDKPLDSIKMRNHYLKSTKRISHKSINLKTLRKKQYSNDFVGIGFCTYALEWNKTSSKLKPKPLPDSKCSLLKKTNKISSTFQENPSKASQLSISALSPWQ
jgi:hypothetical protein